MASGQNIPVLVGIEHPRMQKLSKGARELLALVQAGDPEAMSLVQNPSMDTTSASAELATAGLPRKLLQPIVVG